MQETNKGRLASVLSLCFKSHLFGEREPRHDTIENIFQEGIFSGSEFELNIDNYQCKAKVIKLEKLTGYTKKNHLIEGIKSITFCVRIEKKHKMH